MIKPAFRAKKYPSVHDPTVEIIDFNTYLKRKQAESGVFNKETNIDKAINASHLKRSELPFIEGLRDYSSPRASFRQKLQLIQEIVVTPNRGGQS